MRVSKTTMTGRAADRAAVDTVDTAGGNFRGHPAVPWFPGAVAPRGPALGQTASGISPPVTLLQPEWKSWRRTCSTLALWRFCATAGDASPPTRANGAASAGVVRLTPARRP
jgi:hypothetical protein